MQNDDRYANKPTTKQRNNLAPDFHHQEILENEMTHQVANKTVSQKKLENLLGQGSWPVDECLNKAVGRTVLYNRKSSSSYL